MEAKIDYKDLKQQKNKNRKQFKKALKQKDYDMIQQCLLFVRKYDEMVEIQTDDESEWEAVERCTKPKHQKEGFDFFPKKKEERKTKRIFTRPNCPNY